MVAKDKDKKKGKKAKAEPVEPELDFDAEFSSMMAEHTDLDQVGNQTEFMLPYDLSGQPRPEDAIRFVTPFMLDVTGVKLLVRALGALMDPNAPPKARMFATQFVKHFLDMALKTLYPNAKAATDVLGEKARETAAEFGWTAADGWPSKEKFIEFAKAFQPDPPPPEYSL